MSSTPGTGSPDWIRNMAANLTLADRRDRIRQWFGQLARSDRTPPMAAFEQRLKHQLELLRDEIAQARASGLSWSAIGKLVGLPSDVVRSIHTD